MPTPDWMRKEFAAAQMTRTTLIARLEARAAVIENVTDRVLLRDAAAALRRVVSPVIQDSSLAPDAPTGDPSNA